ncbi:helix-hairpin-helix domain-containing protein [Clostridium sp. AL.422]|uniref:helix-hairpin-helix domain-containing protein n=1 Tax=Clostridium TaxID=1485 RepID=UPI00293DAA2E|nr:MULTISPECIES: helix-hairpin-helix domain-containing protein [unclassified Clostridium]MDV4149960.1 helix-hairpin-helix domain-containing protein [Clostridium sp. AL.422]
MDKKIKSILTVRNLILIFLGLFCIIASFYLYGRNKSKVFKDEYMQNIFVEEENTGTDLEEESITSSGTNIANSNKSKIIVEIKGEVKNPDVYEVEEGSIIRDLINVAGGLTEEANIDSINRAEKLINNQLIVIPNKDGDISSGIGINTGSAVSSDGIININSASISDLQKINGIGEVKAQSIIDYREKNGGFKSIEDIKNVEGIGDKTFEKIKDKIRT